MILDKFVQYTFHKFYFHISTIMILQFSWSFPSHIIIHHNFYVEFLQVRFHKFDRKFLQEFDDKVYLLSTILSFYKPHHHKIELF